MQSMRGMTAPSARLCNLEFIHIPTACTIFFQIYRKVLQQIVPFKITWSNMSYLIRYQSQLSSVPAQHRLNRTQPLNSLPLKSTIFLAMMMKKKVKVKKSQIWSWQARLQHRTHQNYFFVDMRFVVRSSMIGTSSGLIYIRVVLIYWTRQLSSILAWES